MFIKILLKYILGYVRITVEGYYIERFINICTTSKILIWNLKREKGVRLYLNIGIKDFFEAVKIAKKLKCKVKITQKRGIPFLVHKYKKRKIFVITLLVVTILIGISTKYVWNINIQIDSNMEMIGIEEDVKEAGLNVGMKKEKINVQEIANKIRLKRNDIAWMGIELKGTNAIVKLVKAESKPDIVDEEDYCNIVSDKVGVITKINAKNGTLAVNVGDTVNVGTVLINGWMEGKYTGIRYVHAQGDIEAKVWYTKSTKILYNTTERSETGNIENKYKIKFNNFTINFFKTLSKFEKYDTIETCNELKIFSNFYLPIELIKIKNSEVIENQITYGTEEAKQIAIEKASQEIEKEVEANDEVLQKYINTYAENGYVEAEVTYEVLENIGTKEKIVF